nr:SulP family inorganic anion transporter [Actinomycetales bacterium]
MVQRHWKGDILAGITVGIVALPLALAFGISSGLGAAPGIVTAIVAGAVAAIFGGSHLQVSGPTGAMVVVLAPLVATYGAEVVPLLSVMAGIMVLVGGLLGLGRSISLIPWPVVEGFTLGIATIIFLQQIPSALGVTADPALNTVVASGLAILESTWGTAVVTLGLAMLVVAVTILAPRLHRALPGSLIGVIVATLIAELLRLDVPRIGEIPSTLPIPHIPSFTLPLLQELLIPAAAVALLAAIESLLAARVAAGMVAGGTYQPDRELFGQGLANIAAGVFGGMPATGAIARTAVNIRSGGRSRLSPMLHAVLLLGVVALASGAVSRIPLSALAGVLMVTALRMTSKSTVKAVMRSTRSDASVFVLTAAVTIALDLLWAIALGVLVAVVLMLRKLSSRSGIYREEIPGEKHEEDSSIAILRLDGAMFFAVSDRLLTEAGRLTGVRVVILRLSRVGVMDATGARGISEIVTMLQDKGMEVLIKGLSPTHRPLVERLGLLAAVGRRDHLFDEMAAALARAREIVRRQRSEEEAERLRTLESWKEREDPEALADGSERSGWLYRSRRPKGTAKP